MEVMTRKDPVSWWSRHIDETPASRSEPDVRARVDAMLALLGLEARSRVLDFSCGAGRQTLELARRGHRVLGLDTAGAPMDWARKSAREERLNAHFLNADLRQISYRAEFDAAVSLAASVSSFGSERDDLRILDGVRKSLKVGGSLLLDLLNREWLIRHLQAQLCEETPGINGGLIQDQISFDPETGHLENRRAVISPDDGRETSLTSVRVYTLTEIKRLLAAAGLAYRGAWGALDQAPYSVESYRMIVLVGRPADRAPRPRASEPGAAIKIKGRRR